MRAAGRRGRGERARVAARVRDLLAGDEPAARTTEPPRADPAEQLRQPLESASWLPGSDFEDHVPRAGFRVPRHVLRWDPGRKGTTALGVAVVAAVAVTGWWLAAARPHEVPISTSAPNTTPSVRVSAGSSSSAAGGSGAAAVSPSPPLSTTGAPVVVDVAGKVVRPGIYTLAAGARVYDALRAAGGTRRGVSTLSLNLAEPLRDGEQIVVGVAAVPGLSGGGGSGGGGSGATGSSGPATIVNLNTATLDQLETLPGVGPVLGQHILDWREAHGHFGSVGQLRQVSGIGDVRFAQLSPLVAT